MKDNVLIEVLVEAASAAGRSPASNAAVRVLFVISGESYVLGRWDRGKDDSLSAKSPFHLK